MENLKQRIYWLCDNLRQMQGLSMENTKQFKDLQSKVIEEQQKYNKAQERYKLYSEDWSNK